MAYIGKQPVVGNFVKLDAIVTSATATYNLLNGGVAYFPQTANNCIVSLNGVIQSPTSAYTISGSTIVFDSALTSADSIDFILVLGDVLAIGTPSDGTITSAKLASGTAGLIAWQSVQTTGFTASAGRGYPCNTTSAAFTVTLPASPSVGDTIILLDYAGTFDTNTLTVNPNSNKLEGGTANLLLTGDREGVTLTYIDSTQGWLATSGIQEGTDGLEPNSYSVSYLILAGGGGGSGATETGSGGGGAGGLLTGTETLNVGSVYSVTVGGGGTAGTGPAGTDRRGGNGNNSVLSGAGITTKTATGGGGGGHDGSPTRDGNSGGCGGGGSYNGVGGSGTVGQGFAGGNGNTGTNQGAGGGGGTSAVGANGTPSTGGNGGAGTASSITGSSITYGGGGGGGVYNGGTPGSGGAGGGGNGSYAAAGISGSTNLGGGGGGTGGTPGSGDKNGGAGGSGVVILSVPTAKYSSTTTGSPTVTTSGSNTIIKFTGDGSYTA